VANKPNVLNAYAGIGGNRKYWQDVNVVAVEYNEQIAAVYKDMYPQDEVVVADAHAFIQEHFAEFDFIWSSPPCPTHSQFRQHMRVRNGQSNPVYPDMQLYQQIIFLQHNFTGKWVVENVRPYYEPLVQPTNILQRHYFWSNFYIESKDYPPSGIRLSTIADLEKLTGISLSKYNIPEKTKILRNCVYPSLGKHVFDSARLTSSARERLAIQSNQVNFMDLVLG